MEKKNILVTGSVAYDYIMNFPGRFVDNILPENIKTLSVSFLLHTFSKNFGGVAGNIAYNLSLLNEKPSLFTSVGEKDFALYQTHLSMQNIDTGLITILGNEFTANAFIMTDKDNCQIAGFYPGALSRDDNLSLRALPPDKTFDLLIIAPTTIKAMNTFVTEAKTLSLDYLYDPAQQLPHLSGEDLRHGIEGAEIVIGNDYEIELMLKKTGLTHEELLEKANIVITTLGEKGSLIERKAEKIRVKAATIQDVPDPTGAGDAFIAGFVAGYVNNCPLAACAKIGSIAASFPIEYYGTQNHHYNAESFTSRFEKTFNESLPDVIKLSK